MDAARRATLGFAMLVLLWVLVYWWWEPSPRSISYDPLTPAAGESSVIDSRDSSGPNPARQNSPSLGIQQRDTSPTPPARPEPTTTRGVVAPQFRDYTIRQGDTFQTIARREYGTSERASAIARANPLLDPTRIRPGQVIRLPVDPSNIQGREVVLNTPEARPVTIEYQVKPGDTLSGISQAFFGSTAHADHILNANRGVVPSARQLRAGQVIMIPPLPDGTPGREPQR